MTSCPNAEGAVGGHRGHDDQRQTRRLAGCSASDVAPAMIDLVAESNAEGAFETPGASSLSGAISMTLATARRRDGPFPNSA